MSGLTTEILQKVGIAAGLSAVGVADAQILEPARTVLQSRKQRGIASTMQFTYRNPIRSTDPTRVLPSARSLVAGVYEYGTSTPAISLQKNHAKIAKYAQKDYYKELRECLHEVAKCIKSYGYKAVVVADSNALVDRNVAWLSGVGWYGKNANILLPDIGSWVILGSVVTNASLDSTQEPLADGCSSCVRCLDACPTGAIVAPGVVDAARCLAWIVQSPGVIPHQFREAVGNRIYGCDDCQEVCPPNERAAKEISGSSVSSEAASVDVLWLLASSDEEIESKYRAWYIADRDVNNVRRTALVILGNIAESGGSVYEETLRRYLKHESPILRAHAVWAARRLGREDLLTSSRNDQNETVQEEFTHPVVARF